MTFSVFKRDMEYITSLIEIGREPLLDEAETTAIDNYAMKRSTGFTPLLR